jgi:predicted ribosome-associated RNA-binding protein Tma20
MAIERRVFSHELSTADNSVPLFKAAKAGHVIRASYLQEANAGVVPGVKLRNETQSADITAVLDAGALGALAGADLVITEANSRIVAGDVVSLVYDYTSGNAPLEATIEIEIDDEVTGTGQGPAWAG